jgi:osmotically-inducible protein OsmY
MGLFLRNVLAAAALIAALATMGPADAFAQALSDQAMQDRIAYALNTTKVPRVYDLKVSVVDGVTTLTGMVATAEQRAEVERLAKAAGAASLVNSVVINRDVEHMLADRRAPGFSSGNDPVTDTWITNRVRNLFMRDELIRGGDITIETLNGVVSLRGRVLTEPGRYQAIDLANAVPGVRRVVDVLVIGR